MNTWVFLWAGGMRPPRDIPDASFLLRCSLSSRPETWVLLGFRQPCLLHWPVDAEGSQAIAPRVSPAEDSGEATAHFLLGICVTLVSPPLPALGSCCVGGGQATLQDSVTRW